MNQFANEEVAWNRLKDLQREYENSRLFAERGAPALAGAAALLLRRAWWLAGLAMRRAPRPHPVAAAVAMVPGEREVATDAA